MKKSKLSILILVLFILTAVATCTVYAGGFTDVDDRDPLAKDIERLQKGNFIAGYPDGSFRPSGHITRAEFVRMINNIFDYKGYNVSNLFNDVKEGDWYYGDVLIASQIGYIVGYPDGSFRPQGNITVEEACSIFDRVLSLDLSVKNKDKNAVIIKDTISPWAEDSVRRVIAMGIMPLPKDAIFNSTENITRGQVAYASVRSLEKIEAKVLSPLDSFFTHKSEYDIMIERTVASVTDIINDRTLPELRLQNGNVVTQKDFLKMLRSNMQLYLLSDDKEDFDVDGISIDMKTRYDNLDQIDRDELKRVIPANVDVIDLSKLRSFFGF